MARKIRWSILASEQFEETLRFWSSSQTANYSKLLFSETIKITNLLTKFPSIGRRTNQQSIRRVLVDKKYAIYYYYDNSIIDIKLWRSLRMNPEENEYET